ncbi:MAG TPA: alpha/beta fold hydrolase [Dongiaceae bacterium]|nr:alpha/beta fold hydrolase [Dongiaceae bacterium]
MAALLDRVQQEHESALVAALQKEGHRRLVQFLDGVRAYRHHPFQRPHTEFPVVWQEGTSTLRRFGSGTPTLFIIPSLVNRATILDLIPSRSFLSFLADEGLSGVFMDWDRPGPIETAFGLDEYVERLVRAYDTVKGAGKPLFVLGYCMGGNLAVALACFRRLRGLLCLATPWDFHAEQKEQALRVAASGSALQATVARAGGMPADVLQSFFVAPHPLGILNKFRHFATLDPASPEAELFVALEDWLNDGVTLVPRVADQVFRQWYGENRLAAGTWRIGGKFIRPERIRCPSLCALPSADRIVPPESAAALAQRLSQCEKVAPSAGHIGMMIGTRALNHLWRPLRDWLHRHTL